MHIFILSSFPLVFIQCIRFSQLSHSQIYLIVKQILSFIFVLSDFCPYSPRQTKCPLKFVRLNGGANSKGEGGEDGSENIMVQRLLRGFVIFITLLLLRYSCSVPILPQFAHRRIFAIHQSTSFAHSRFYVAGHACTSLSHVRCSAHVRAPPRAAHLDAFIEIPRVPTRVGGGQGVDSAILL